MKETIRNKKPKINFEIERKIAIMRHAKAPKIDCDYALCEK